MSDTTDMVGPEMADDDRLIRESGTDARVAMLIEPVMRPMGFRLVRVRLSGQNGLTLQVMAERADGTMTVEDCEELSRAIAPVLDLDDPIDKAYHLEVSSPGIDRPLVRKADFAAAVGHVAKVDTSIIVAGRKRFRGRIAEATEQGIRLEREKPAYGEDPMVEILFEAVDDARLMLSDDLIREALSRDNKARKEAKKRHGEPADDAETADQNVADQDAGQTEQ